VINFIARYVARYRCRHAKLPETVCRYVDAFTRPKDLSVSLKSVRYVVFDTETTGFDLSRDNVISIGAVAVMNGSIDISDSFEVLIRCDRVGDGDAVSVHGLLRRDLVGGCNEREALDGFLNYIGDSILVAQHAGFDIAMMNAIMRRHYHMELLNDVLDTASLAKRLEKGPYYNLAHKSGEYRLDSLLERYHIRLYDRHTSAGDAFLTAQLFQRLLYSAASAGITNPRDLLMK